MTKTIESLIHSKVKDLKPYLPGKSIKEIQQKYQLKNVIKLASNENAWGCSQLVLESIKNTTMDDIYQYPNTYLHPFFQHLQHFLQVPKECLFISNGSDTIFTFLIQAFALPQQKKILTHQYAFMGYEIQAHGFGLDCEKVAVDPITWQFNLQDMIAQSQHNTAIVFLANPNNPTGQCLTWNEIAELLEQMPKDCLLVIDEAYYEYADIPHPQLNSLLEKYPNLIITRTFSKAYGMASLRLGYAIAHPKIIEILKKIQLPFSINQMALNAGIYALEDQTFIKKIVTLTHKEKNTLENALKNFPFKIHAGQGNFTTIELPYDSLELVTYLESQGIIVRPLHAFGLTQCVRITIGQAFQNEILINVLQRYKEITK